MKVKIGPYVDNFGPYQLAEKLCFWAKKEKDEFGFPRTPDWVHKFGEWLAYGSIEPEPEVGEVYDMFKDRKPTLLYRFLVWIQRNRKRKVSVKIDRWDTWSADYTLGLIALPMLKQLREQKQGAPFVDNEDVPKELQVSEEDSEKYKKEGSTDEHWFDRWDYVLGEMIFAFETKCGKFEDWEEQFVTHKGKPQFKFKKLENGDSQYIRDENTEYDWEGRKLYAERISNGFRLFGKYYENLWS